MSRSRVASSSSGLSRREMFRLSWAGLLGASTLPWLEAMADESARPPARKRACILLWMNGGPSQMDTFDLKPGHENGGSFKEIATAVPGIKISEHLPKIAALAQHLAIIRSMSTKEGDHGRATYLLRNGYLPQPPVRYPTLGSLVAKELGDPHAELPSFVSISPFRNFNPAAFSPGFLGSQFAPLFVGEARNQNQDGDKEDADLTVADLDAPKGIGAQTVSARLDMLNSLNDRFIGGHAGAPAVGYKTAYDRAVRLMRSKAAKAFDLDEEPAAVRDAYGRNRFGQGCLLARRLVERGVPFVEVTLGGTGGIGWDTHQNNFDGVKQLSGTLDPAWATLMTELKSRGLLDSTLIVWMGEFGRTPKINPNQGRDHYPNAWSTVLAGGPIRGGQVVGRTSADGTTVEDRPVSVPDMLATVCRALGIDPMKQNVSNVGRPIRVVDPAARPVAEIVG
jgi:hypothetical protein